MLKVKSFFVLIALVIALLACSNEKPKPSEPIEEKTGASPVQLAKASRIISTVTDEDIAKVDAKKVYKTYCIICHGAKGNLNVNGAKDLSTSRASLEESVAQVYHGKGLMTPFRGILSDVEIVAVSKYIQELKK